MRYLRAKHIRKALRLFHHLCGIRAPYKVLLDGNFIAMCLKMKVDLLERVPKFLQSDQCHFFVPRSAIRELELLGEEMKEAVKLCKHFSVVEDTIENSESVTDEILSIIGESNTSKYIVATQEVTLRSALRAVPGVPLMYLNRSVLVFEEISPATLNISRKNDRARMSSIPDVERRKLDKIEIEEQWEKMLSKKQGPRITKAAKGPNPLSMKKKTVKKVRSKKKHNV